MSVQHDGDTGQQPQPQPIQRLPNECLYLIVNHLWDDLKTLHTLLFVNHFLFDAALPLIMDKPLDKWDMNYIHPKVKTDREKFFVLILTSLLHYQQQLTGRDAASILADHGLQLTTSTSTKFLSELEPFLPAVIQDDSAQVQQQQQQQQGQRKNPMTVDYSKYMTLLNDYQWQYISYHEFVRLIEMPEEVRRVEETIRGTTEGREGQAGEEGDDIGHTEDIQQGNDYKDILREGFAQLLLHYNVETITQFSFHVSEACQYLPIAPKMAKLRVLGLNRDASLPDQHLQDAIAFIRLNQRSFPRKPCLQLELGYHWYMFDDRAFTSIKEARSAMFNQMKSKLDLYRAVGKPEDIDVEFIPGFYGLAGNLNTENLRRLSDQDQFRIDMGEGPDMDAFLKRCHRLQYLRLNPGHPNTFSWAAQRAKDQAKGRLLVDPSSTFLPMLEKLELWSERPYRYSIHALNDSMVAFAKSLRTVNLFSNQEYRNQSQAGMAPWLLSRALELSRQIRTAPLANSIGDWPFPLPFLRVIRIELKRVASVNIGSLDQCPNLEELVIRFGTVGNSTWDPLPDSNDPGDDPRSQAPLETSLFPKWTLPKLKLLELDGAPALRFDYDSLQGMPNLETLNLQVKKVELEDRLKDIPRLSMHSSRLDTSSTPQSTPPNDESPTSIVTPKDSPKSGLASTSSAKGVWTRTWTLPKLKSLEMVGPPAAVFTFDWLKGCPSLTSATVALPLHGALQRLPLVAFSPATYTLPLSAQEYSSGPLDDGATSQGPADQDIGVFMESKLETLHLRGPWVITGSDLTALLTDFAPFLKTLYIQRIQQKDGMSAGGFLTAFKDADEIFRARYGLAWDALPGDSDDESDDDVDADDDADADASDRDKEHQVETPRTGEDSDSTGAAPVPAAAVLPSESIKPLPGRSLLSVYANYNISKRQRSALDLKPIEKAEAPVYREYGIRVYNLSNQFLVDKYNKQWYIRNREKKIMDGGFSLFE
ncbi:hypothetical protein BGX33_002492 [Mortierella sp. NVP41]|nr:hypothetical protein BGX33_002492 [Mortierella sp. NVP41]